MIRQLYSAALTATTPSLVSLEVQEDDIIVGISWDGYIAGTGCIGVFSLSFSSSDQAQINDTRSNLHTITLNEQYGAYNGFIPINEKVVAGEKLHLHLREVVAITSGEIRCSIHFASGSAKVSQRRR